MEHDTKADMARARKDGTVSIEEIRHVVYCERHLRLPSFADANNSTTDGKKNWERREQIVKLLESDPAFSKAGRYGGTFIS